MQTTGNKTRDPHPIRFVDDPNDINFYARHIHEHTYPTGLGYTLTPKSELTREQRDRIEEKLDMLSQDFGAHWMEFKELNERMTAAENAKGECRAIESI